MSSTLFNVLDTDRDLTLLQHFILLCYNILSYFATTFYKDVHTEHIYYSRKVRKEINEKLITICENLEFIFIWYFYNYVC